MQKSWICPLLCWICLCASAPGSRGQNLSPEPIRVESSNVVVPVLVLDKTRVDQLHQMDLAIFVQGVSGHDSQILDNLVVPGLSVSDFQIFEDGKEQTIKRLTCESLAADEVQSTKGASVGSDRPTATPHSTVLDLPNWPTYLIAYAQPPSRAGSCHTVAVKVDRPNSLVYSRTEYCNTKYSLADPLEGTTLGDQLERDLNSKKGGKIALSLSSVSVFGDPEMTLTDVVIEFPQKTIRLEGNDCDKALLPIGILGAIYSKDGTLKARFSHLYLNGGFQGQLLPPLLPTSDSCVLRSPDRYETQAALPPGEYNLRVVLSEGKKLGRAEAPLEVEAYDWSKLAMSGIALAHGYRQLPTPRTGENDAPGHKLLVSKGFDVIRTADTRFKKGESLDFYLEIYDPRRVGSSAGKVEAYLRILNSKTGQVVKALQPVDAAPYAKTGDPIIPIGGGIDISGLPKGSYSLEAQATDSVSGHTPWRAVNFSIK